MSDEPTPGAQAWWDHLAAPENRVWTDAVSGRPVAVTPIGTACDQVSFLAEIADGDAPAYRNDHVVVTPPADAVGDWLREIIGNDIARVHAEP